MAIPQSPEKSIRRARLQALLDFAHTQEYVSQTALVDWLAEKGFRTNQPQVSIDLQALNLVPFVAEDGKVYLGRRSEVIHRQLPERYVKLFAESVLDVQAIGTAVIVHTIPNCAQAAATVIDGNAWPEAVAVLYGINSVVILTASEEHAQKLLYRIEGGLA